jgi:peptide/nickel transport system substrate-binding protein/oligopeptide transport system substrate-binding protein
MLQSAHPDVAPGAGAGGLPMKRTALLILVIALALPAVSCKGKPSAPASPAAKVAPSETVYRFPIPTDPPSLDPAHITDTVSDCVARRIFEGLVKFDTNLRIVPALAEKWESSPDGKVWTFHVRKGAKFHNGRDIKAADFVYSFERMLDPRTKSERADLLKPVLGADDFFKGKTPHVKGIVAKDDYTLEITLSQGLAPFIDILAMSPLSVVPKEAVEREGGDFSVKPTGSGPFVFAEWKREEQIVLKANRAYWGGNPSVSTVIFRILPDEATRFEEFKNGNLEHTDVPQGKMSEALSSPKLKALLVTHPAMDMYGYGFNCQKPPFKGNVNLRLAVNYAIDRDNIVRTIMEGKVVPMTSYVPPGTFYTPPKEDGYKYNPELAKKYLAKAGYPRGKGLAPITLYIDTQRLHGQIAEAVQGDLRKIGVKVEIRTIEWATFLQSVYDGEPTFFQNTWLADYPDPDNWLFTLLDTKQIGSPGNIARFSNKRFDDLTERARTIVDEKERQRLYAAAERIAYSQAPWCLLFINSPTVLVQPWVKGMEITAMDRAPQLGVAPLEKVTITK